MPRESQVAGWVKETLLGQTPQASAQGEPPPPRPRVKAQAPIDATCSFCKTPLGSNVFAVHTCKCMHCGEPVHNWQLCVETPPQCDPCMLGIEDSSDDFDDDFDDPLGDGEHMVRG